MLFYTFSSQEERREFGGSYFIEMQYCKFAEGTEIQKLVSVDAIEHWKNDSLYIYGDDVNTFMELYSDIFTGGIYNNGESGVIDTWGINYYLREYSHIIIEQIKKTKPLDYQLLLNWLDKSNEYIGFYILGL